MLRIAGVFVLLYFFTGSLAKCPEAFDPWMRGRCIQANPSTVTYHDAVVNCHFDKGVLMSIHSAEENANIVKGLDFQRHAFIGLKCNVSTDQFQWMDGTPLDYTNFKHGPPVSCSETPQVTLDPKSGIWTAFSDAGNNSYLCEYEHDDEYPCDIGYDYVEEANLCVQPYNQPSAWSRAEGGCRQFGPHSHLLSIHNSETNNAVAKYAHEKGFTGGVHIGLSKQAEGDAHTWSDGTDLDYSNFQAGMPLDEFGSCIALRTETAQWLSVYCDRNSDLPFLCATPAFTPKATIEPPGCPESAYFLEQGYIFSPGYPISVNAGNASCDYYLYGAEGSSVTVTFHVFELNVCCDSLSIYPGAVNDQPLAVLTGEYPAGFQVAAPSDNIVHMELRVGDGRGVRGFHASFTVNSP